MCTATVPIRECQHQPASPIVLVIEHGNPFEVLIPPRPYLTELHAEMTKWRRDFHAHPEIGFEEHRTSEFVATKLAE